VTNGGGIGTAAAAARRFVRFAALYGVTRAAYKAAGRLRVRLPTLSLRRPRADIAIAGCGQFAFSTIAYFLRRAFGPRIAACHDIDPAARESFARAMQVRTVCATFDEVLAQPDIRILYVASNHASHAPYAAAALQRDLDVYVEKPIAVSRDQLLLLLKAARGSRGRMFAGYNRPLSAAIRELRRHVHPLAAEGISLQCFVAGHKLGAEHWYRRPEEGTRVCGNIGHWLDLMVHILSWRGMPDRVDISITWADDEEPDDNISIAIASDRGDLYSVMLTARCEPFEGINETIHFQHGEVICKIDDFRRMTVWRGAEMTRRRFWPKDVGHQLAILQPFRQDAARDWQEVVASTLLMLHIADMVRARQRSSSFSFLESMRQLSNDLSAP
jgi:predicted dehydrogenase